MKTDNEPIRFSDFLALVFSPRSMALAVPAAILIFGGSLLVMSVLIAF